MFSQNIILQHYQIASIQGRQILYRKDQMQVSHVARTWWNSLALFLIVNLKGVLKPYLGLDLIDPGLVLSIFVVL